MNKIGPLWAHKGPYGPIRALWAHMGPNPDRVPTRTGPQPGPGPLVEPLVEPPVGFEPDIMVTRLLVMHPYNGTVHGAGCQLGLADF